MRKIWISDNSDNAITGNSAANVLRGFGGDDTLAGAGGNDTILGGTGNDILNGGAGNDFMIGEQGDDVYVVDSAFDRAVESAAATGGRDLVISSATSYSITGGVENLILTGAAITGVGNSLNNTITGNALNNVLHGNAGHDTLNGGVGRDTMAGGTGNDTYFLNVPTDRIVETSTGGIDTVNASFTMTLGSFLENLTLTGSASLNGTGNSLNNIIRGNAGANVLKGGLGNDLLVGGNGADTLTGEHGRDTLVGGVGNDVFEFYGTSGIFRIEDELGIDTLSARNSRGAATIDMRAGTTSRIGTDTVTLNSGTRISNDLDLVFLQDLSGSFSDDVATVRTLVPSIVSNVKTIAPQARFGYSTFVDKPTSPFGGSSDYVYLTNQSLTTDQAAIQTVVDGLSTFSGNDSPESQIEALMQVALRTAEVGFRSDSVRVVVLFTDANFHKAGDFTGAPPNDGDAILDGTPAGTGEDYPSVAQLKAALLRAGILPVFAVTDGAQASYETLVDTLGFGVVVDLATDSANIVSAINTGLRSVAQAIVENAIGSNFGDRIVGNNADNSIAGGVGNDTLFGGFGNDKLLGEAGNDTLDGQIGDDIITGGLGKDVLTGGAGNDDFVFNSIVEIGRGTTRDRIVDFTPGRDDLDLRAIDANGAAPGNAFTFLAAEGATFTGVAGQLRWDQIGTNTFVEGDTNGDRVADFQIELTGLRNLTAADFFF